MTLHGPSTSTDRMNNPWRLHLQLDVNPSEVTHDRYVGKLYTHKNIKNVVAHNVVSITWEKYNNVRITDLAENLMLFEFDNKDDVASIMDLSPWAFQGSCLSLKRLQPEMRITYIESSSIQSWTQIHGLELGKLSEQNAWKIGTHIWKVTKVENLTGTEGHIWR